MSKPVHKRTRSNLPIKRNVRGQDGTLKPLMLTLHDRLSYIIYDLCTY